MKALLTALCALALLAGCAGNAQRSGPPTIPDDSRRAAELLHQFAALLDATSDEQKLSLQAAQAGFDSQADNVSRLRLAMHYALPRVAWHDEGKVISLLAPLLDKSASKPAQEGAVVELALLFHTLAADRLRQARLDQRRQDLAQREAQKTIDDLKQKIDALRRLDRDVLRSKPKS